MITESKVFTVVKFPTTAPEYLNFPFGGRAFKALVAIVGYDEAKIIQHIEYLHNIHRDTVQVIGYLTYNITTPERFVGVEKERSLQAYMKLTERTLHRRLDNIRTNYRITKDNKADPANFDFDDMYYATAYLSVDRRTSNGIPEVRWYRNAEKLGELYNEVRTKIAPKKKPKITLVTESKTAEKSGDLATGLATTLATTLSTTLATHKYNRTIEYIEGIEVYLEPETENLEPVVGLQSSPKVLTNSVGKPKPQVVGNVGKYTDSMKTSEYDNSISKKTKPEWWENRIEGWVNDHAVYGEWSELVTTYYKVKQPAIIQDKKLFVVMEKLAGLFDELRGDHPYDLDLVVGKSLLCWKSLRSLLEEEHQIPYVGTLAYPTLPFILKHFPIILHWYEEYFTYDGSPYHNLISSDF